MPVSAFAVIENNMVINVILLDRENEWAAPEGCTAVEINEGVVAGIGYLYENGVFTAPAAPTQTPAELIAIAEQSKAAILQHVNSTTAIWQTQLALGIITDADKLTLTAWMKYAQDVSAIDTTATNINWPTEPAS